MVEMLLHDFFFDFASESKGTLLAGHTAGRSHSQSRKKARGLDVFPNDGVTSVYFTTFIMRKDGWITCNSGHVVFWLTKYGVPKLSARGVQFPYRAR